MIFTHIPLILSLTTPILFLSTAISLRPSSYLSQNKSIFKLTLRMAEGDVELGHVDFDHTVQLLLNYEEESQYISKQHRGSIYMVPKVYRDLSPRSYTPQVVSIGPLHHQDEHLKEFEVQKATFMHNLFHNVLGPSDSTHVQLLKECVMRVSGSIDRIKACYIGMQAYSDSELVEMMVKDACFILAFLYERVSKAPINIYLDMVLIENQIPFFVLQDIFECTFSRLLPTVPLAKFILSIQDFCNIFQGDLVMENSSISSTHDHILGFLHKSYQNPDRDSSVLGFLHKSYQNPDRDSSVLLTKVNAHTVVELYRSGVRFSKKLDAKWPMAMELEFKRFLCFPLAWSNPTLKMPVLRLYDGVESIIRNLIIYEQSAEVQTCVTSYMYAMDMLTNNPEDVTRLVKSQVLVNRLGSDEEAANLINSMLEGVLLEDFYYRDEWVKMDQYYNSYWPRIKRTYFSNPWSIIGLLSGSGMFVLTVIQTVFTVVQTVYAVKAA